ncbi:MAG: class I SAM-dependent methyltransferase [Candidatus Omnitrophica bacterium]|nr:class I SAM-dependent methyltransferase [Candidatus Omnitrophota bacterium]
MSYSNIENTGERILPEKESPLMLARHLCAYEFASKYVSGKKVMDLGCGEGYGADYLAGYATDVLAVDYEYSAIAAAGNKYKRDNLRFQRLDINEMASLKENFDIICSFQVIEHILDASSYLNGVKNHLKPGGVFICSTPNRLDASGNSITPLNKFHVREYLFNEFESMLKSEFKQTELYGLNRGKKLNLYRRAKKIGIFNALPSSLDPVKKFYKNIGCREFILVKNNLQRSLDFIAVCKP